MSCPFLDPEMLKRIPEGKRAEMKEMYERMKNEEKQHLKIDTQKAHEATKPKAEASCPFSNLPP
jgi:rubrerythrin